MINAIIYDLDGTLLDSIEDLHGAINALLERLGSPAVELALTRALLKSGSRALVEGSLRTNPGGLSEKELYLLFNEEYEKRLTDKSRPFLGIPELLVEVKNRGILQAITSNKKGALAHSVCEHFFPGQLDLVLGTIPLPAKPDPAMLLHAMEELGVSPQEVLYIGDTIADRHAAINAGIRMLWADWGYGEKPQGQASLKEPLELLEHL